MQRRQWNQFAQIRFDSRSQTLGRCVVGTSMHNPVSHRRNAAEIDMSGHLMKEGFQRNGVVDAAGAFVPKCVAISGLS
jgi:hypothetical protein